MNSSHNAPTERASASETIIRIGLGDVTALMPACKEGISHYTAQVIPPFAPTAGPNRPAQATRQPATLSKVRGMIDPRRFQ